MSQRSTCRSLVPLVLFALVPPACGPARAPVAADPAGTLAAEPADSSAAPAADDGAGNPTGAAADAWSVRVVRLDFERQPDGVRYSSFGQEGYELEPDGVLRYSGYFGGMPIELNHMDGVEWPAGSRSVPSWRRSAPSLRIPRASRS